jgi:hypothetical protein
MSERTTRIRAAAAGLQRVRVTRPEFPSLWLETEVGRQVRPVVTSRATTRGRRVR